MKTALSLFLSGAIMMGYLAIGFFFLRFFQRTRDTLFAVFAASFWVLVVERVVLLLTSPSDEIRPYVYLIRFSAFVLILVAIYLKNRPDSILQRIVEPAGSKNLGG